MLLNALNVMGNCRFLRQKKQVKINGEWVDTRSLRYLPLCDENHSIVSIRGGLTNHIYNVGLVGGENAQIETSNTGSGSIEIAPTAIISGVADSDTGFDRPITDAVQLYNCKIKELQYTRTKKLKLYCSSLIDKPNEKSGFFGGSTFSEIYLEPSAISNLTNMCEMFRWCVNLESLDAKDWNTSNVTNMAGMFLYCYKLESLDVSKWDVSNCTSMFRMFEGCESIQTIDVSNWDVSNCISLGSMFEGCSKLQAIDISKWNTSNCLSMNRMFKYCSSLKSLDITNFTFAKGCDVFGMFIGCTSLKSLNVTGLNFTNADGNLGHMFNECSSLVSLDLSSWNTSNITKIYDMFIDCSSLVSLDLSSWDTSKVDDMDGVFYRCSSLVSLNISGWDMSKVTDRYMEYMFYGCKSLRTIYMIGCNQTTIDKIKKALSWDNILNQVTIITE